jgi:uncharacterized protein
MKLFMDNRRHASWGARRGQIVSLLAGLLLSFAGVLYAQTEAELFPPKPEPAVYVHDPAGWLTADQRQALEMKLRAYWDSTSTQIVVMIRKDIGDYDKASYAFELGNRWGIGAKDKDNGLVLLIKTEPPERGVFIATGYGLEGALPDITAGRIIRNTMAPYFRQGAYFDGINAGVDEIIGHLSGEYTRDKSAGGGKAAVAVGLVLFFLLLFMFLFGVLMWKKFRHGAIYTHDGRNDRFPTRRRGGFDSWGGGFGGWGGGGSGGWGGGGGGFGGGFGGGSFGGGGAGGDW